MSDISVTAANVLKSASAARLQGIIAAGVTVAQGKVLYQLANSTFGLADSNGSSPSNTVVGYALTAGSAGQPVEYVPIDPSLVSGATLTSGDVIYLSDTPGGMTSTYADIASGSTVIILGVVNTDGTLNFNPVVGGVK